MAKIGLAAGALLALAGGLDAREAQAAPPPVLRMPKYQATAGDDMTDPPRLAQEKKQFESAYENFKKAAAEYQSEVKEYIQGQVTGKQKTLAAGYQAQIDKLDQEQFDLRREAIARLESFIYRHRDHDVYTPDALFRLAELYYEDTIAAYNRASDNFAREMDLYNRGKLLDMPSDAKRDFSRSIAIYKYLHWVPEGTPMDPLSGKLAGIILDKRWPNHKQSDVAMYLQGFCEFEMREADLKFEKKAVDTLAAMEDHYPKSRYVPEAWLRVGEIHFDNNEYEDAAKAYGRAATKAKELGDNKNYSLALYKLGWSMFQLYKYADAVRYFQQLIEFEDEVAAANAAEKDETKKKKSGFDLRKEAIEYLAKSLAEPSWDDDSCDDFGSETTKGECAIVDPRARPILYTACVLEPEATPEMAKWAAPFKDKKEVSDGLARNYEARNSVRKSLISDKAYVYDILKMYGETLFNQREDDYYWQAVRVMRYVIGKWPLARDAQDMQRKVIQSLDILARAGASYELLLAKDPKDEGARIGLLMARQAEAAQIEERNVYLQKFGKKSEWYAKWGSDKDLAAQVDDFTGNIRWQFALLNHAAAQKLKAQGNFEEAFKKYAEAGAAYEDLLKADPEAPNAYKIAWTLAECWYWAGVQCTAARNADGELIVVEGQLAPTPPEQLPTLRQACVNMHKSIDYYTMVRDWKGPKSKDDKGQVMEKTEEAAWSAIDAAERVLSAKASFPKGDPEYMDVMSLPTIRPSSDQDKADLAAAESLKEPKRVTRLNIDPVAVEWILAADGYVVMSEKYPSAEDPRRAEKLSLKAAELLYKNRNFDPWLEGATPKTPPDFWSARLRFRKILTKFPGTSVADEAVKNLLASFGIEADIPALEAFTFEMKGKGWISEKAGKELEKKIILFKQDRMFEKANALFEDAQSLEKSSMAGADPDKNGEQLATARQKFAAAGDAYAKLRVDAEKVEVKRVALLNAVTAYYRAEQWDKCIEALGLAEEILREALKDPKWDAKPPEIKPGKGGKKDKAAAEKATKKPGDPPPETKEDIVKGLEEVLEIRADLNYKFFKIEETIKDFVLLYQNKPDGPRADYYLSAAAQMAFYNSNWDKAIELNRELINRFEKEGEAKKQVAVKDALWQIQTIWRARYDQDTKAKSFEKARNDTAKQIDALDAFISRYQADKATLAMVFRAMGMIAEIYKRDGDKNNANRTYNRIIDLYNANKDDIKRWAEAPKGDATVSNEQRTAAGAAASAAAQATFMLMQPRYEAFLDMKLVENAKLPAAKRMGDLQNQVKKMLDVLQGPEVKFKAPDGSQASMRCGECPIAGPNMAPCRASVCKPDPKENGLYDEYYTAVASFGSQNWSYAAFLYRARMLKFFAKTIYKAPQPPDLTEAELEAYMEFLEKLGATYENRAIRDLGAALLDAEAKGVVNAWVTELRSEMNKYKPKEYPLLRDEIRVDANPEGTLPQVEKELR
ncbi:MAG: tetratricopeptide repeat protein [Deltaproteobacteria bacterium]|nr:tetratricopeptide repeat protein [Deltaproteobacteria bacterium]